MSLSCATFARRRHLEWRFDILGHNAFTKVLNASFDIRGTAPRNSVHVGGHQSSGMQTKPWAAARRRRRAARRQKIWQLCLPLKHGQTPFLAPVHKIDYQKNNIFRPSVCISRKPKVFGGNQAGPRLPRTGYNLLRSACSLFRGFAHCALPLQQATKHTF